MWYFYALVIDIKLFFIFRYKYIEDCSSSDPVDCIDRNHTENCVNGYKFDKSLFSPTVVTEVWIYLLFECS